MASRAFGQVTVSYARKKVQKVKKCKKPARFTPSQHANFCIWIGFSHFHLIRVSSEKKLSCLLLPIFSIHTRLNFCILLKHHVGNCSNITTTWHSRWERDNLCLCYYWKKHILVVDCTKSHIKPIFFPFYTCFTCKFRVFPPSFKQTPRRATTVTKQTQNPSDCLHYYRDLLYSTSLCL